MQDIFEQNLDGRLCFFYIDLLDGFEKLDDNPIVHILRDDYKFENLLRNLDLKQQLKVRNIKNELDRYVKLINMLILNYVIRNYEAIIPLHFDKEIVQGRGQFGKPYLTNRPYQYNISDEKSIVSIAIGFDPLYRELPIGVDLSNPSDIESFKLSRLEDFYKLDFRDIFSIEEVEYLDTVFKTLDDDSKIEKLSQIWALKESYCKYLGVGITAGMENFSFANFGSPLSIVKNFSYSDGKYRLSGYENPCFQSLGKYEPKNISFKIPKTRFLCSIFSHYNDLCVIEIDPDQFIKEFI